MSQTEFSGSVQDTVPLNPIAKDCNDIITKRQNELLPKIAKKIEAINRLKRTLEGLRTFQRRLKENDNALIALREKAPQIVETIKGIDLRSLLGTGNEQNGTGAIAALEKELNRLYKRFGRKAIQIALVGHARLGKSTFLQSVSGLKNDVIPTSSYSDCTGAVSIIENTENKDVFSITIEYYTDAEFAQLVNSDLEKNGLSYRITGKNDLSKLKNDLEKELNSDPDNKDVQKFLNEYFNKGTDYMELLGRNHDTFEVEEKVIEYVAKYKIFNDGEPIPSEYDKYPIEYNEEQRIVSFNKYIAVKSAHIVCHYPFEEAGKIIMLDTIGLGNKQTEEKDRATMYKVLQEDTDAAIYNFLIPTKGMSEKPVDIITEIDGIFTHLKDLSPEKWFSINVNCFSEDSKEFKDDRPGYLTYSRLCKKILSEMKTTRFGMEGAKGNALHAETVCNMNKKDVIDKMMIPVLRLIGKNVSELDNIFMSKAERMADDIYAQYNDICSRLLRSFDKIITHSSSFYETFTSNFNRLPLRKDLGEYVGELYAQRDDICPQIMDELKPQIANLTLLVPSKEEIMEMLNGMGGGHIHNVYFEVSDHVTARIISKLKEVSTQTIGEIEEKVKTDIAKILYESGRLGELSVATGKINGESDAIKWLSSFVREKLAKHPNLEDAVKAVLNFRMNIEGFIFAECIKACEILSDTQIVFPSDTESVNEKAYFIWDSIIRKVKEVKEQLSQNIGLTKTVIGFDEVAKTSEMAKPSLLMWCMADSFSKQFLDINHGEDLKSFYHEYAPIIWRNEFKMQEDIAEATEEVNALIAGLKSQNDRSLF